MVILMGILMGILMVMVMGMVLLKYIEINTYYNIFLNIIKKYRL